MHTTSQLKQLNDINSPPSHTPHQTPLNFTNSLIFPSSILESSPPDATSDSYQGFTGFGSDWKPITMKSEIYKEKDFLNPVVSILNENSKMFDKSNFFHAISSPQDLMIEKYTYEWLVKQCESFAQFDEDGNELLSEYTIVQSLLSILQSKRNNDSIQADLCDLLGFEHLDFISELLGNRDTIRKVTIPKTQKNIHTDLALPSQSGASSSSVTIQTEEERKLLAKQRKLEKRLKLLTLPDPEAKKASILNEEKLNQQANALHELQSIFGIATGPATSFQGVALPEGAQVSTSTKGWDELYIPPPDHTVTSEILKEKDPWEELVKPADQGTSMSEFTDGVAMAKVNIPLVPVTAFSAMVRPALRGIKSLNPMQSTVFDCAYNSSANMLICAPTGAGKTNVALTTILREVERCTIDGVLQKNLLKIVYVAPMKALAQEVSTKFSERLACLGLVVREFTGDMQLTKTELAATQLIVTTPEKWDVVTRKSSDGSLLETVRLLILDEVHLLHEERGPVIEVLVARTHRYVETSQKPIRILGLSATLPNPKDVAAFLGVPPSGLFVFGPEYRPVPLAQTFIGVKEKIPNKRILKMNECAYDKALQSIKNSHQVMIFVHSRKETGKLAQYLITEASERNESDFIQTVNKNGFALALSEFSKIASSESVSFFRNGIAIHHAGLSRAERTFVEEKYNEGLINILICTATLAWGVNLPAHTVIIKGTQLYDPSAGGWTDVGILDIMQIFGRAGRPQYDTSGEAFLITSQDKIPHYITLLTAQLPIESQLIKSLPDHLNAEIILGTVSSLREAEVWLTYTYMYARMMRNPLIYGVTLDDSVIDPSMLGRRTELITNALKELMSYKMVKFDSSSGNIYPTDVGRVAALYYIDRRTMNIFNEKLRNSLTDSDVLNLVASSKEFSELKVRQEELGELEKLREKICLYPVREDLADGTPAKANILLQTYISRAGLYNSSLGSDSYFIQQSAGRIARALFELTLRQGNSILANKFLTLCKCIELRLWPTQHPLRQIPQIKPSWIHYLEEKGLWLDELTNLRSDEVASFVHADQRAGTKILHALYQIPWLNIRAIPQPLTRDVLRVTCHVSADFQWNNSLHGTSQSFWIWIESSDRGIIYQYEYWTLTRDMMRDMMKSTQNTGTEDDESHASNQSTLTNGTEQTLVFTIPLFDPIPSHYIVRIISDRWLGSETIINVDLRNLSLPSTKPVHTPLLPLMPLPITALLNPIAEKLYEGRFTHFNPVQTQVFHAMYHSDTSALVGAPTGSGKTIIAELALLRAIYKENTIYDKIKQKIVYIAPMKALARERVEDWSSSKSLKGVLGLNIVELTGDSAPSSQELLQADVLVTTPEKWDGVSREWRSRSFVSNVCLVIIDEIHLLGQDRGPVLEVIVSRMRCIAANTEKPIRIIGLSTALSNANDLGDWLGVEPLGLFNFPPAVRPVPLSIYVSGYPGNHYCPRMALMNKPVYSAITTHSHDKPTLIFVSSRRQTRLTGLDLVSLATANGSPRKWVTISEEEMETYIDRVVDPALQHLLAFGIGMHHAGLVPSDRSIVEELFLHRKILVLICTATLAWGVNFPAHLVIVKGTEYFDAKTHRYVDFPITDVLQMIGRAGRPQFDTSAKACILVHEPKKPFYHKFLHSPFPVESSLHEQLYDHLCAEIAGGTIASLPDALDWLTWTFFYRRLLVNPTYYGLHNSSPGAVNAYLIQLLASVLKELETSRCIHIMYDKDRDENSTFNEMSDAAKSRAQEIAKLLHIESKTHPLYAPEATITNETTYDMSPEQIRTLNELDRNLTMLVQPTSLGSIASFYYVTHKTIRLFCDQLTPDVSLKDMFWIICCADEFTNLPVRHNEDKHNENMIPQLIWPIDKSLAPSPYGKTSILFQARFEKIPFPVSDYATDLKLVLDQSARLLLSLIDICADAGWLQATLNAINIQQSIIQGRWLWDSPFINLPSGSTERVITALRELGIEHLSQLIEFDLHTLENILSFDMSMDNHHNKSETTKLSKKHMKKDLSLPSSMYKNISGSPLSKTKITDFLQKVSVLPRIQFVLHGIVSSSGDEDTMMQETTTRGDLSAQAFITKSVNRQRIGYTTLNPSHKDYDEILTQDTYQIPTFHVKPNNVLTLSFGTCRSNGWKNTSLKELSIEDPLRVLGPTDVKSFKEGWWIIIGNQETDEVLALSRVNINVLPRNSTLQILVPDAPESSIQCTAYLMSDSYIGLDQQYDFILKIGSDEDFMNTYEF